MSSITRDAIIELNENQSTRLKAALFGDASGKIRTWALLTAENPMSQDLSPEENNKLTNRLKSLLKRMYIPYTPVEGSYGGIKEHSFMLFNLRYSDAEFIAKTFKQTSFFFATTNKPEGENRETSADIGYYETADNCETYEKIDESNKIDTITDVEAFFSRHGDFRFSIDMPIFHESLFTIYREKSFNESFNENLTSKHAAFRRHSAYAKPLEVK